MAPATKRRRVTSSSNAPTTSSYPSSIPVSGTRSISSYGRIGKAAHLVGVGKEDATKKKLQLTEADANALNRINQSNLLNSKAVVAGQAQQHGGTNLKRRTSSSSEEGSSSRKAFKTQTGSRLVHVGTDAAAAADEDSEGENTSPALPTIAELPRGTDSPRTKAARRGLAAFTIKSSPTKPRASRDIAIAVKQEEPPSSSPSSLAASNTLQQSSSSPSLPTPCPRKRRREGVADSIDCDDDSVPQSVQEFVDLHTSFLTALSLHYAHNGTAVPVDIGRQLGPSVSRIWGRRAINVDDVRRLLGVQQRAVGDPAQAALLSIWDYGKGKTCLEYCAAIAPNSASSFPAAVKKEEDDQSDVGVKQERKTQKRPMMKKAWSTGNIIGRQPLDSSSLSRSFAAWVHEHFAAWVVSEGVNAEAEEFVKSLPLARLHRRAASRAAKSTLLSKGQARLTELRVGAVARQARDTRDMTATAVASFTAQQHQQLKVSSTGAVSAPVSASATPLGGSPAKVQTPPSQRSTSLRDRIRAKESLLALQPSGPSAEQLARRAALQRLPDIMGVLSVLASNSGSSLSSFSPSARQGNTPSYASLLTARSGITPTPRTTTAVMHSSPLTQRLSSVTLSGLGGNSGSDDVLLAALGGGSGSSNGSVKSSSSTSFIINNNAGGLSRSGSMSSTGSRGLEGMFGPNVMQQSNLGAMSMSVGQVVERVQNSMRSPMSRVEIETVLQLIADEVAPEWLTMKKVGSVSAVSFRPSGPARGWKDRLEELIAACGGF